MENKNLNHVDLKNIKPVESIYQYNTHINKSIDLFLYTTTKSQTIIQFDHHLGYVRYIFSLNPF